MPHSLQIQLDRQHAIREILKSGPAENQQHLVDQLTAQGFEATQSCVSRDLKDIGAIKTAAGYELPDTSTAERDHVAEVADLIHSTEAAGPNLLVIKTAIGAAQPVALALDRSGWPEIVGTIGGDDTIFTATPTASAQRNLIKRIERAAARA